MKSSVKKLLAVLLVLAMALSIVACSGGTTTNDSSSTPADNSESTPVESTGGDGEEATPFTITLSPTAGPGVQEGWEAVAEGYKAYHPEATIVVDPKPGDGYGDWIQATTADFMNSDVDIVVINQASNRKKGDAINWNEYMEEVNPYDADGRMWKETFSYQSQTRSADDSFDALNLFSVQVVWFYNMDIFEEVGVEPPTTWDEFVDICEKIDAAGYQPISIEGDYRSFYEMRMGWLARIYPDQTSRTEIEIIRAQPGDYCYDPDKDGNFELDLTDPWNDYPDYVTTNNVRRWAAIYNGDITFDEPGQHAIWENFKKIFPKYAGGDAFFGTTDCLPAFYQGKAAMIVSTGGFAVSFANDQKKLAAGEEIMSGEEAIEGAQQFRLGSFNMPSMTNPDGKWGADEVFQAPVRTIEVATGFLGAFNRNAEQTAHVVDFMMYYTSAEGMTKYVNAALEAGWAPDGSVLVYGVEFPADIQASFDSLNFIGNIQRGLARGLQDNQESTRRFYDLSQQVLNDEISVDDYCRLMEEQYMEYFEAAKGDSISMDDLQHPERDPSGED